MPPASPGGSPRSASRSNPGSFQTTSSALGLGAQAILCVSFEGKGSVSYSSPASPSISLAAAAAAAAVASVVSDSVRPLRRQPTRLPRPWDSPGKNTGVGCHFLLQCMKVKRESEVTQSCPSLSDPMDRSLPGSSIHPWDFLGKSTTGFQSQKFWELVFLVQDF